MMKKPLPIGIGNFERVIKDGYCYIDLRYFFEDTGDAEENARTRPLSRD